MTGHADPEPIRVLFVCTHNAGRSALAAALGRAHGSARVSLDSAGIAPDPAPNATTVASLAEVGIDDSAHQPKAITEELVRSSDVVVMMRPGMEVPQVEGVRYETWSLPDPGDWDVDRIRPLRDEIDRRVKALIAEYDRP